MASTQPDSTFTFGLHYFCDHRCWRCPLSDRCAVFARWTQVTHRRKTLFSGPGGRVASVLAVSLDVTMEEAMVLAGEAAKQMPAAGLPAPGSSRKRLQDESPLGRAERDPLVARGGEYAQCSWPVLQALRPVLSGRGDFQVTDAAERLEETCATVASKIFRAVSSALDPDADPADTQSDANGSAKVALLLIAESRQAWRVLMRPGQAVADGAPARFVAMLDALETDLLRRFPRALEFVRPGFDTGEADGCGGRIAQALLAASQTPHTA
jgi:hypothetical protein